MGARDRPAEVPANSWSQPLDACAQALPAPRRPDHDLRHRGAERAVPSLPCEPLARRVCGRKDLAGVRTWWF